MISKKRFDELVKRVERLERLLDKRYVSDVAENEKQTQIIREYLLGKQD